MCRVKTQTNQTAFYTHHPALIFIAPLFSNQTISGFIHILRSEEYGRTNLCYSNSYIKLHFLAPFDTYGSEFNLRGGQPRPTSFVFHVTMIFWEICFRSIFEVSFFLSTIIFHISAPASPPLQGRSTSFLGNSTHTHNVDRGLTTPNYAVPNNWHRQHLGAFQFRPIVIFPKQRFVQCRGTSQLVNAHKFKTKHIQVSSV